ncbi:helix-turn-helix transcriptional regulator [Kitasatospora sp. NPDC051914]|uniref:helix-turn-helix transcriptional regulator n=1 Tax=Kitasatospora sp. NPDC051914 TaxID=3154945 RepID=UPI003443774B
MPGTTDRGPITMPATGTVGLFAGTAYGACLRLRGLVDAAPPKRLPVDAVAVDAAAAGLWDAAVRYVAARLGHTETLTPRVAGRTARLLVQVALEVFPVPATRGPAPADGTDTPPATLRLAVAFIESHAGEDIVLADISAAAFVTPRALQYAFRRHLDTTPLAHLRRVRLDAAHRDLLAADPATATVTEIAARWGFGHPGRFAASYREAYRTAPHSTLAARA